MPAQRDPMLFEHAHCPDCKVEGGILPPDEARAWVEAHDEAQHSGTVPAGYDS